MLTAPSILGEGSPEWINFVSIALMVVADIAASTGGVAPPRTS